MADNKPPSQGMRLEPRLSQRLVMTPRIRRVAQSYEELGKELLAFMNEQEPSRRKARKT